MQPLIVSAQIDIGSLLDEIPSEKNAIINGGMDIWQRGTSFVPIFNETHSADRWRYERNGTAIHDITRDTDVPTFAQAGRIFNFSLKLDCTTADTVLAVDDFTLLRQNIEGYNWAAIAQKPLTLSFWIKATAPGIYCVYMRTQVGTPDRSFVKEFTVNVADTWERKVINIASSPSAGTWNYLAGAAGVQVGFTFAAGTDFYGTNNVWQTGNFIATANQINTTASAVNNVWLTGIQLEEGTLTSTTFESRTIQTELALCQRHYEKSYNQFSVPGSITPIGQVLLLGIIPNAPPSSCSAGCNVHYKMAKSAFLPTVTVYSPITGASGVIRHVPQLVDFAPNLVSSGEQSFFIDATTPDSRTGWEFTFHWTAESEI